MLTWSTCLWHGPGEFLGTQSASARGPWSIWSLALEWRSLRWNNFFPRVIQTIQTSRQQSTIRIYNATWWVFCSWYSKSRTDPSAVSVAQILQEGLDRVLTPNTIQRQVAVLSSILSCGSLGSLTKHPTVCRFLRGTSNLHLLVVHRYPSWDMTKIFTESSF